jgi:O-antigen biosynthesis protein
MDNKTQKIYAVSGESGNALPENSSHRKMLDLIGEQKTVVDFGCNTGYMAQFLNYSQCKVVGVDISSDAAAIAEQYCTQVIVADLDFTTLAEILPDQTFDVAIFGDVLEHLRDPWKVLEQTKSILNPGGYVVVSIPNIAHGAIRLALLQGNFDYEKQGILDNTHLRFFTRKSVEELFEASGYLIEAFDRTTIPVFSAPNNNIIPSLNRADFQADLLAQVETQPEVETVQFIIRAYPATLEGQLAIAKKRNLQLNAEKDNLLHQLQQSHTETEQTQQQLQQTQQQLQQTQLQIQHLQSLLTQAQSERSLAQAEVAQIEESLQQTQNELCEAQSLTEDVQTELLETKAQQQETRTRLKRVRGRLERSEKILAHVRGEVIAIKTSKFWKVRSLWFKIKGVFGLREQPYPDLPPELLQKEPDSPSIAPAKAPQSSATYNQQLAYEIWMKQHTPTDADLKGMADMVSLLVYKPLISIVMPVYNPPVQFLRQAIASIRKQVYPHWQLCIADDASTNAEVIQILKECAQDDRVTVVFRSENGHIVQASNSALEVATGEFVALMNHADVLSPDALYEIALMLNRQPSADMIYSDEDKIDEQTKRQLPFFKPDWCPDLLLSRMYTCHLGVYRRSLVSDIGGFRPGFEGSQDYDLVLRLTEKTDRVFHIPKVLYHGRMHEQSAGGATHPYAHGAEQRAIAEALQRRGEPGQVIENLDYRGHYTVRYDIANHDLVSIIIPTRDQGRLLNQCLESVFERSTYPNYEVILVDNGTTETYAEKVISDWLNRQPHRLRCYSHNIPFNYSKLNNFGVSKANGKYIIFLNNDTEVITPDWIEAMVEQAQRSTVGAVGARLLYSDHTVQHSGVILGIGGVAGHFHKYAEADDPGCSNRLLDVSNYSAVTAACLCCRREVLDQVNGFDEELSVAYNDVDFCLRIMKAGFRNLCLPHAQLYHHESKSRGYEDTPEKITRFKKETDYMRDRWSTLLDRDPCYSPNLTLHHEDSRIRESAESAAQLELAHQLKQSQNTLKRVRDRLHKTQAELAQAKEQVTAMETSKFWQVRSRWFALKKTLGMATQEKAD